MDVSKGHFLSLLLGKRYSLLIPDWVLRSIYFFIESGMVCEKSVSKWFVFAGTGSSVCQTPSDKLGGACTSTKSLCFIIVWCVFTKRDPFKYNTGIQ